MQTFTNLPAFDLPTLTSPAARRPSIYERGPWGRPWTNEDDDRLRRIWLREATANDVARIMSRPLSECAFRAWTIGLPDRERAKKGRLAFRCMCCTTPFMAEHRFNRLCGPCKTSI